MQFAEESFDELDAKLFDQYVELKVEPIVGQLEQSMYTGQFDWSTAKEPMSVRDYIKECISHIVEVRLQHCFYSQTMLFVVCFLLTFK